MALQTLEGAGAWVPDWLPNDATIAGTTYVIDADGEKAVLVLRCPRAGTLDRFDAQVAVVTNSPDNGLRFSLQGVNAADGQNDGTILGATNNAFVLYAHTVTTGWKSTNFGEAVTVTRGQLIACVVDIGTFTAGDSIAMAHLAHAQAPGLPYGISVVGTKQANLLLLVALHYTDGYAYLSPLLPGADTITTVSYDVDTGTADEWGLAFQVPFPCKLNQVAFFASVAAGADFEVLVYDASDNVLATLAHDGDVTPSTSFRGYQFILQSELTLVLNTTYRVTIRPTTLSNVALAYYTFQSAELMAGTLEGGDNFYMTSRLNQAGAWTDYNSGTFRRPRISLHLTAFDDAVSAGGGLNRAAMPSGLSALG